MNLIAEQAEQIKADLAEAEKRQRQARADMDKELEAVKAAGVKLHQDEAKYQEFKSKFGDPYQSATNEVVTLRERFAEFVKMDPGVAPDPQGNGPETKDGEVETKNGRDGRSLGDVMAKRLTESAQWKSIARHIKERADQGHLGLHPVEILTAEETKALLGDAAWERKAPGDNLITGGTATSAGAGVLNMFLPGSVDRVPFAPIRLLDLIPKATTDSDTIDYLVEDSFTNAAAETAEATSGSDGALAEAAATWTRVQDPVQLIGHYIPATTRALEDFGQLRSLLERRLTGGVMTRLNNQVYDGDGTSPNISGIVDRSGYQTQALGSDSRSDAILKAVLAIRTTASVNDNIDPTSLAVALHPNDWTDLRLEKDANGGYVYGPPSGPVGFAIWGMNVVQDMSLSSGTGLVGAFNQAELFVNRGLTVSSTDSHDDWFISEIIAIKATMRVALAIYKPAAFCGVTGI